MICLNFDPFPELITPRLVLRRPRASDDEATFRIRTDEAVNRFLDRPKPESMEDARKFLLKLNNGIDNNESIWWAIAMKGEERLLGSVCFWNISQDTGIAEVGFELDPSAHGKGIMSEALEKVLEYGFGVMQLKAIEGWAHNDNDRSIRLMEKFDFVRDIHAEGLHCGKVYFNDMVIYALANYGQFETL